MPRADELLTIEQVLAKTGRVFRRRLCRGRELDRALICKKLPHRKIRREQPEQIVKRLRAVEHNRATDLDGADGGDCVAAG